MEKKYEEFGPRAAVAEAAAPSPNESRVILPPWMTYVNGIDSQTGAIVPIPVPEQLVPRDGITTELPPEPTTFEKAMAHAERQPDPLPATGPTVIDLIDAKTRQYKILGIVGPVGLVAFGGTIWLICDGIAHAGPAFHTLAEALRWGLIFLGGLAASLAMLAHGMKARLKTQLKALPAGKGGDVTLINALFYSEKTTNVEIGRQTGGFWKGDVNNHLG